MLHPALVGEYSQKQSTGRNSLQAGTVYRQKQSTGRNSLQAETVYRQKQFTGRNSLKSDTDTVYSQKNAGKK